MLLLESRDGEGIMTISNYLTLLRIVLIPVFVAVLLDPSYSDDMTRLLAVAILLVASLTDALDGYLARLRNEVTRLGTLLDPIADKLLISAAFISLVQLGYAPAWMVVIIIGREFAVSGMRLIAANEGFEIKVSYVGKFKMVTQVAAAALLIYSPATRPAGTVFLYLVIALSIISMLLYFHGFLTGMNPERRRQLSQRRNLKQVGKDIITTPRRLRKSYQLIKEERRRKRKIRKQVRKEKFERRLHALKNKRVSS
jgi:CDP-diacylglycerol--glycerol-3-phosphate 3-phosphatidyltransferase